MSRPTVTEVQLTEVHDAVVDALEDFRFDKGSEESIVVASASELVREMCQLVFGQAIRLHREWVKENE